MFRRSLNLYFTTILFTLALASFAFAGNGQCPADPPPPPDDGDGFVVTTVINTDPAVDSGYQLHKGFWELLTQSFGLF